MTAPAYRASTVVTGAMRTTITVTKPTGTVDGDIMIAPIYWQSGTVAMTTVPTGWTLKEATADPSLEYQTNYYWKRASGEPASWDWIIATSSWTNAMCISYSGGAAAGDPINVSALAIDTSPSGGTSPNVSDTTTVNECLSVYFGGNKSGGNWSSFPAGYTEREAAFDETICCCDDDIPTAGGTGNLAATCANADRKHSVVIAIAPFVAAVVDQEGFRFRNDDGNEAAATWAAAQDTNLARQVGVNTRLRVLLNTTGDVDSTQYQLEFRKIGVTPWSKVE